MQEWYLGWEKVSCLERCPQFRIVLIEVYIFKQVLQEGEKYNILQRLTFAAEKGKEGERRA